MKIAAKIFEIFPVFHHNDIDHNDGVEEARATRHR